MVLGVLVLLVAYYALADRYTPFTTDTYMQSYVIQLAPQVGGQVVKVLVNEGDEVKSGALLFELDPRPFEHKVAYLQAKLVEADQQVKQLGAELAAAKADHERRVAEASYADSVHRQEQQIFKTDSTTERRYLDALQKNKASQASVQQSTARRRVENSTAGAFRAHPVAGQSSIGGKLNLGIAVFMPLRHDHRLNFNGHMCVVGRHDADRQQALAGVANFRENALSDYGPARRGSCFALRADVPCPSFSWQAWGRAKRAFRFALRQTSK